MNQIFNDIRGGIFLLMMIFITMTSSGCHTIDRMLEYNAKSSSSKKETVSHLTPKKTFYIQSFTGQNTDLFRTIFYQLAREQSGVQLTELLPENLTNIGIVRLKVLKYLIWENKEPVPAQFGEEKRDNSSKYIIRRNALVSIRLSLFEADTGKRIINRNFSQPFQQIYYNEQSQKNRRSETEELSRLTHILMQRVTAVILSSGKEDEYPFEQGLSHGLLAETFVNKGDSRIKKGVKQAQSGFNEKALLIWKLSIFEPDETAPNDINQKNKASAYYNIGVLHTRQQKWLDAADKFSQANRLNPTLRYAQAWGSSMHNWMMSQKETRKKVKKVKPAVKKKPPLLPSPAIHEKKSKQKKDKTVIPIEENQQLLLNPQLLWPLDPVIKKRFSPVGSPSEINGSSKDRLNLVPVDLPE